MDEQQDEVARGGTARNETAPGDTAPGGAAPSIGAITLGVEDLERSLAFYRALGFTSPGVIGTEFTGDDDAPSGAVVMMDAGSAVGSLTLCLYERGDLAKDAGVPRPRVEGSGISLGRFVGSRDEVDAIVASARRAGASVPSEAHERPWGIYSGYFADPDGHLWEIVYAPAQ